MGQVSQFLVRMVAAELKNGHPTMGSLGRAVGGYSREAVRLALNMAVADGIIASNPFTRAARREAKRKEREAWAAGREARKIAAFWAQVGTPTETGCREWQGSRNRVSGYGAKCWRGINVTAHRVAYELTHGPIPVGLNSQILHHCDNPPCCEPSHLYLGTCADNMRDRDMRGRNGKGKTHYQKDHEPDWGPPYKGKAHGSCRICARETYRRRATDPSYRKRERERARGWRRKQRAKG